MRELKGRNALVTGASRGIGVYIARALAEQGVNLVLVARTSGAIERLSGELVERGVRAFALTCDLERAEPLEIISQVEQHLGGIDLLINNAGLDMVGSFAEQEPLAIERLLRVDLLQPMQLARAALPKLLAQKRGHIVNVSSLAGKTAAPYNVAYAAAKSGLIGFTHGLRAELRGSGVSASVVCPGFVAHDGMFAEHSRSSAVRVSKLVGMARPEQVAKAVVRAITHDKAELLVAPGPLRLFQAFNQLAPDGAARMQDRLGVTAVFRTISEAGASEKTKQPS